MLSSFHLDCSHKDSCRWSLSSDGMFKVKILATEIGHKILPTSSPHQSTLRNSLVPEKFELFVWRALLRRLPVRSELEKRGIDLHSLLCPICDDVVEFVDHSLIFCSQSLEIWGRVFKWLNKGNFSYFSIRELFEGNDSRQLSGFGKKVWQAVIWIGAYLIWKNRNNKVFKGNGWSAPVAFNEIQIISFDWISNRSKGKKFEWHTWLHNPSSYL
ncbi:uncharacterized protein [Rutidosis leptorrhynchoides]|uniref:uncharacterized protein n=1 Tax=Rutidosis leptorrhynchoides TaxID=125765 RepID=UPI003A99B57C